MEMEAERTERFRVFSCKYGANTGNLSDVYPMKPTADKEQKRTEQKRTEQRRVVTYADRCRLGDLLSRKESRAWGNRRCRAQLEVVLERAEPVEARSAPNNLVTMNSTIRLADLLAEKELTVTLIYPDDVDLAADAISVLEPLGTALLGRKVGDVIQYIEGKRPRRFRVDAVVYQPEQSGALHL